MLDRVAGAEWLVDDRAQAGERTGGTYSAAAGTPWRLVWHTTEVVPTTLAGCRSLGITHDVPPHLWASFEHDWVGQSVPLTRSAYALRHDAGDPQTNRLNAVQVEVFGFAGQSPLTGARADWLGRRVLGPLLDAGLGVVNVAHVAPSTGSDGAGEGGAVRFSWAQWAAFGGQCGHANVPGNIHWDPGVADYLRIARAAIREDDMTPDEHKLLVDTEARSEALLLLLRDQVDPHVDALLARPVAPTPAAIAAVVAPAVAQAVKAILPVAGNLDIAAVINAACEGTKRALREGVVAAP